MKTITAKIKEKTRQAIWSEAKKRGIPVPDMARRVLEDWYARRQAELRRKATGLQPPEAMEVNQ